MEIPKPTDADKAKFQALAPDDPRVVIKPMFGNLGAYVNGNMFMGLFGSDIGVKLADADRGKLRDAGGGPFGPAERPMGGYITLPEELSHRQAATWVAKSLAHVAAFPVKQPKPSKRAAATTKSTRSR
jgi:TfoX/Sxy family transcriptional regulator of competence genes